MDGTRWIVWGVIGYSAVENSCHDSETGMLVVLLRSETCRVRALVVSFGVGLGSLGDVRVCFRGLRVGVRLTLRAIHFFRASYCVNARCLHVL
jgi:hypothetical protein